MSKNARLCIYLGFRVLSKFLPLILFIVIMASHAYSQTSKGLFPEMSSTRGCFEMARLPGNGNNPPRRTFAIPKTIVCFGVSLSTRPYLGVGTGTSSFVPMFGEAIEGINITSPSAGSIKLKHTVDHLRLGTCFIRPGKCPTSDTAANRAMGLFSYQGRFADGVLIPAYTSNFFSDSRHRFTVFLMSRLPQFK